MDFASQDKLFTKLSMGSRQLVRANGLLSFTPEAHIQTLKTIKKAFFKDTYYQW